MTRQQAKQIRRGTGHQLLLLTVFGDRQTKEYISVELDRRAAVRPRQSQATTNCGTTENAA